MRIALATLLLSTAALAAPSDWASDWTTAGWPDLAAKTFERDGVRVSNCHLEKGQFAGLEARLKCYVFNASPGRAAVRVEMAAVDSSKQPVFSTTLSSPMPLASMAGYEFVTSFPISEAEWQRAQSGARLRVWVAYR